MYKTKIKLDPISGVETVDLFNINPGTGSGCEFVVVTNLETGGPVINLKIESDYPVIFKKVDVVNGLIVIGYGNRFAIFNLEGKYITYETSFDGYFGSFEIDGDDIFVATDSCLLKIKLSGELIWTSEVLGVDGVVITSITGPEIRGDGEWDPPGGWEPFVIDRETGRKI